MLQTIIATGMDRASHHRLTENFTRREIECKCGCGADTIDHQVLHSLQKIRNYYEKPITITSGIRCKIHNRAIGGRPSSLHLTGRALDWHFTDNNYSRLREVHDAIEPIWHGGIHIYPKKRIIHMDTRGYHARW